MENKKYRILYNEQAVVDVLEDIGTTYLGANTGYMVMVDTKENAKVMLEAIGVNTSRLFSEGYYDLPIPEDLIGTDYLDSINNQIDPMGVIEGGIV